MAIGDKNEPVDLVVVEPCVVEGKHLELGTVLKKQDPEFAFEMAACGKMRLASPELISDMKSRAKAEKEAAESRAASSQTSVSNGGGLSATDLAKIIETATAKGIETGIKLALESTPVPDSTPGTVTE